MEETQKPKNKTKIGRIEAALVVLFVFFGISLIFIGTVALLLDKVTQGFLFSLNQNYPLMSIEQRTLVTLDQTNSILFNIDNILEIIAGFVILIGLEVLYFREYRENNKKILENDANQPKN